MHVLYASVHYPLIIIMQVCNIRIYLCKCAYLLTYGNYESVLYAK